jgi:allantoinase
VSYDLVVRSKRAVLPAGETPAAVAVLAGRIAAVERYDARLRAAREEDLGHIALLPGLVDTHVDLGAQDTVRQESARHESVRDATAAAAAGGVTTILDVPLSSAEATVSAAALRAKRAAADGNCVVDVGFWGGAVPGNLAELRPLHEAGAVGFKCSLADRETAGFAPLDGPGLRSAFAELAAIGAGTLMAVHAEDAGEVTRASGSAYSAFLASRPPRAERRAIEKVVAAAAGVGADGAVRAHIAHLSAAECVALIAGAKAAGIALTAQTCPHYLFFAAEEIPDGATQFKCCPPIRDAINREALWRGLETGAIDCVVSGHSPRPAGSRVADTTDFGAARAGISSLQLSLAVMWTAARRRRHRLSDVVRWMAQQPAAIAGLSHKGRLAAGCDADLVAFDPGAEFKVGAGPAHPGQVTAYEGRMLAGAVKAVWLRGVPVAAGDPPRGRLISRV